MGTRGRAKRAARRGRNAGQNSPAPVARDDEQAAIDQATAAAHEQLAVNMMTQATEATARLENSRKRLLEILKSTDSVDLVSRASIIYLNFDPNTHRESDSDQSPAHIEYLAFQAMATGWTRHNDNNPEDALESTYEALTVVREMFEDSKVLLSANLFNESKDLDTTQAKALEYSYRARLHSLGIRSTGYREHLFAVFEECFEPFEKELRSHLGFTAKEAVEVVIALGETLTTKINRNELGKAQGLQEYIRQVKRARRGKKTPGFTPPPDLVKLPWTEALSRIRFIDTSQIFSAPQEVFVFTAEEVADHCSLSPATCDAFLKAFSCHPSDFNEAHHSFPGGAHPLTAKPVIDLNHRYMIPVIGTIHDTLRARLEDLICSNAKLWKRYLIHRGKYLERKSVELLTQSLPGAQSWQGVDWKSPHAAGELDGLINSDMVTLRLQCKAGRLSASTRRGATDRMRKDVGTLIQAAANQHETLEKALSASSDGAELGFTDDQAAALDAPIQFEVIVCLDDVTVWSTMTSGLKELGMLSEQRPVPWVLSLTDLLVVTDLLEGPLLIHYLLRRSRIERDGRVRAHDELDWVGNYISDGLHFDYIFDLFDAPDAVFLATYTEDIDSWYFWRAGARSVPTEKPQQTLPPAFAQFIRRLETERPKYWIIAALALLEGDDQCRSLWEHNLQRINQRVNENGWTNATQTFRDRLGLTIFLDYRIGAPDVRIQVREYCEQKADQTGLLYWVGISEDRDSRLFITLIERGPRSGLLDLFVVSNRNSDE